MADTPGGGGTGPSDKDVRNAKAINEEYNRLSNTLRSIGSQLKLDLTAQMENFDEATRDTVKKTQRDLNKELEQGVRSIKKSAEFTNNVGKTLVNSKKIEESINTTKNRQLSIENLLLELELEGIVLGERQQEAISDMNLALSRQIELDTALLKIAKKKEESMGRFGALIKGITRIPIIGQFFNAEKVLEEMEKTAEKGGSKWKVFGTGIVETFKSLARILVDPSVIITGIFAVLKKIYELVVGFNAKVFELAKNLGTSVDNATRLQRQFIDIANSSKNFGITSKEVAESYAQMTESLGFMAPLNNNFAETSLLIQKRLGLSAEEMGALATQSALSGKSLMDTYKSIEAARVSAGAQNKLQLTQKQIIDGIAKTSSVVLANFKGSVGQLSEAVVRAAKLGTNLELVNKQGESLLDFEQSISSEFEAQLLTGRNINLTRARELALMGDTRGLMEELNRQNITLSQYESMNVIQREAFAKAIGLSTGELSKQLIEQDRARILGADQGKTLQEQYDTLRKQGKTREEIAGLITESAEKDLYRASIQDKFNSAVEKLKDTLGSILAGPLEGIINKFADFVSNGERMKWLGESIQKIFTFIGKTIEKLPQILSSAVTIAKVLASLSIARAVASLVGGLSMGGPAGAVAGLLAGGAAYAWLSSLMDGAAGNAPSISTTPETGMAPMNTTAALATTATTNAQGTQEMKPIFNVKAVTYVGTERWGSQTQTSLSEDHSTSIR